MIELRFHYWCDNEAANHPPREVEGDTITVYLRSKQKLVDIDVCDDCLPDMPDAQVQDLAARFGRDPKPQTEDPKDRVCPLGCKDSKPFRDRAGMRRHMTRQAQHDEKHARYLADHPESFS